MSIAGDPFAFELNGGRALLWQHPRVTSSGTADLPDGLLQKVAERGCRIALVVGGGCSLESPTDLRLASVYSRRAFEVLKANGVLDEGDCDDPSDLSLLASAVHDKGQGQSRLVEVLPVEDFRLARPNDGHLLAVALMLEGAVAWVATLNFDMALTNASGVLEVRGISNVAAPERYGNFGTSSVVYLHRNAHESDFEKWVLRKEAIEHEWETGWEAVVAVRLATTPVLVFAGLGSKAAALTETLRRVKKHVRDLTTTYLVDPSETSSFASEIELAHQHHHIRLGWVEFMTKLGQRLVSQFQFDVRDSCQDLAVEHDWDDWEPGSQALIEAVGALSLLHLGELRARWLGERTRYAADSASLRKHVAYLLAGLGQLVSSGDCRVTLSGAGTVTFESPSDPASGALVLRPISGQGVRAWSAVDAVVAECAAPGPQGADVVLVTGFTGTRPADPLSPLDITGAIPDEDIRGGLRTPRVVNLDELRVDHVLRAELSR